MISLWEKRSFTTYDIIIVGAGITGLSTAASLKEKDPKLNILVLERGLLPTGASTKNAGFACFGSLTELQNDLETLGEDQTKQLVEMRWNGLLKTRGRLGDKNIGFKHKGGYELVFDKQDYQGSMNYFNDLLMPLFNKKVFSDASGLIGKSGFGSTQQLIYNQMEGQIDTGRMMKSLWSYCNELGINILTGALVTHLETDRVIANIRHEFKSKRIILCTNAFTNGLIEDDIAEDINPGRGIVMAIQPANKLTFEGTFHYDEGYYYFRDLDGLLIFGGGRNLDPETEKTTLFEINQKIKNKLISDLKTIILPNQEFDILDEWTGIMAFGSNKQPIIKKHPRGWYMGVRLGGMGVAIGSQVGEELARMVFAEGL
jgi:glycine/D-amino acid oxidase-like deaminating enzyme